MQGFWSYLGGVAVRPRSTFARLLADPGQLLQGVKAVLLMGILYTLTVAGLAAAHARIVVPPWTAIPVEDYYFWETFFALPVFAVGWLLAAALVQLSSKVFGGQGTFEGTCAALGFAMTIPSFVTWVPETVGAVLFLLGIVSQAEWLAASARPGFWQVFAGAYQYVALAWYLALFWIAVKVVQGLRWWQAGVVGTLAVVVVGLVMVTFIR